MPPPLGKAAPAVVVVDVRIASLVAMSTPSNVELVVINLAARRRRRAD